MSGQVQLEFETQEQAIAYAQREGLNFSVESAPRKKAPDQVLQRELLGHRKQPWTH